MEKKFPLICLMYWTEIVQALQIKNKLIKY